MILPIKKLVESINPSLTYTITDLAGKCIDSLMYVKRENIENAVRVGKIKTNQPGGKNYTHLITGQDFINWVLTK